MILYNYSSLKKRDAKVYSVAGTKVSSTGISTKFLTVVGPSFLFGLLLGILIVVISGHNFYNPLGPDFSVPFIVFTLGGGLGMGLALWYIKIDSYRLYEYLVAYFKPKKTYHNLNTRDKEYKLHTIKTNGVITTDL